MSVPLDRLYHYLDDQIDRDMVIYRWLPHGSRKLEHCSPLETYGVNQHTMPIVVFHDQEPLNLGDLSQRIDSLKQQRGLKPSPTDWHMLCYLPLNVHSKYILVHSELASDQVEAFSQRHAVPVYYWCHAVIARDWFRYAEHDPVLGDLCPRYDFLIYQRSWSGSREYRLKFTELLIDAGIQNHCLARFCCEDPDHYREHRFANSQLSIARQDLENHLLPNTHHSSASADYCNSDYAQCSIEVVLETLCDDTRLHLTEKTLRPIACGRPFLLAASPGSLQYLQRYGFRTFGDIIDESYDQEPNVLRRLNMIVQEMQRILNDPQRHTLYRALLERARYNQQWFFSAEFHNLIMAEYQHNITAALEVVQQSADCRFVEEYYAYSTNLREQFAPIYQLCMSSRNGC
jgi:hypothetical protein